MKSYVRSYVLTGGGWGTEELKRTVCQQQKKTSTYSHMTTEDDADVLELELGLFGCV